MLSALALVLAACSSSDKRKSEPHASSTAPTTTGTTLPGQSATPRASAAEALQALLAAEQRGDHETSYRLLSPAGRQEYPDQSDWKKRTTQLPPITSFTIDGKGSPRRRGNLASISAEVRHKPGLDPFIGLSASRERQTWTVRRQGSGWLVDPDPAVTYEFPPTSRASDAALSWTRAVQACDKKTATGLQAVGDVYGTAAGAAGLCRSKGAVTVGKVGPLEAGPSSADLIAQYSTDILAWARVVPVTAPSGHFSLVLAPLGDGWKIVGLTD